jgi:hypothetical protein
MQVAQWILSVAPLTHQLAQLVYKRGAPLLLSCRLASAGPLNRHQQLWMLKYSYKLLMISAAQNEASDDGARVECGLRATAVEQPLSVIENAYTKTYVRAKQPSVLLVQRKKCPEYKPSCCTSSLVPAADRADSWVSIALNLLNGTFVVRALQI